MLRLSRADPLESDNELFLTVEAKDQGRSLVISDSAVDGGLVALMLAPPASNSSDNKETQISDKQTGVDVEPRSRIAQIDLAKYSTVILFNPSELSGDDADKLSSWVQGGGGLMVVLGPDAKWNTEAGSGNNVGGLANLLPGRVRGLKRLQNNTTNEGDSPKPTGETVVLNPLLESHPLWNIFERPAKEIPWVNYPINQYWEIESLEESAAVIANASLTDHPILIESLRGAGRIIVMTLPYPEPNPREPWSELYTTSADAWPGFALFLGTVQYLATQNKHPLNYSVGATAVLENNPKEFPKAYELLQPNGEVIRVEADEDALQYTYTQQPGQYRLRGVRARGPLVRGFSVNIDREELSLKKVNRLDLEAGIGKDQLLIAKNKEDVQSSIGEGRYGRDLSPFLWVILAMMVMAEQTMSSRFYANRTKGKP
jgi:hypothetical protein